MPTLIRRHALYFLLILAFIVAGGVYLAMTDKTEALFFFNANRHPFTDAFFRYATKLGEGYVYVLAVLVAAIYDRRKAMGIAAAGVLVMVVSLVTKAIFAVDRPLAMLRRENLEWLLNPVADVALHSGATSFPSGHAMSAFCFYTLMVLLLPRRRWIEVVAFLLAFTVAISRVYLFQHYWPDVYAGGIIGTALALLVAYVLQCKKCPPWLRRGGGRLREA